MEDLETRLLRIEKALNIIPLKAGEHHEHKKVFADAHAIWDWLYLVHSQLQHAQKTIYCESVSAQKDKI